MGRAWFGRSLVALIGLVVIAVIAVLVVTVEARPLVARVSLGWPAWPFAQQTAMLLLGTGLIGLAAAVRKLG